MLLDAPVVVPVGTPGLAKRYERLLAASIRETRERLDLDASNQRIRKAMVAAHLIRESVRAVLAGRAA